MMPPAGGGLVVLALLLVLLLLFVMREVPVWQVLVVEWRLKLLVQERLKKNLKML